MTTPTFNHAPGLGGRHQMLAYNAGDKRGIEYSVPGKSMAAAVSNAKFYAHVAGRDFVIVRDVQGTVVYAGESK